MQQYLNLLNNILENGVEKPSAREGMPQTIGLSFGHINHDLQKGFPLLTTKRVYFKGIVHELLWILRGDTNIKYLVDNDVNIWNEDAYRFYLKKRKEYQDCLLHEFNDHLISFEDFIELIKFGNYSATQSKHLSLLEKYVKYFIGDLGKVYGHQLRNQNNEVDQLSNTFHSLQKAPFSRYHIFNFWNKADTDEQALPACHVFYQFITRLDNKTNEKYLDLNMYQRSCDMFLGVPFNIASMSLMLTIFAKASKMNVGTINWVGGDCHIYENQIDSVKEQLQNEPLQLPSLKLLKEINSIDDIENLKFEDFQLENYNPHKAIKGKLSTGLNL